MLPIHKIEAGRQDGFDIAFEFYPEDMDPMDSFDDEATDMRELYYKLETGQWCWFRVRCVASINNITLGDDHLGGCLYDSYEQFIEDNDYAQDMIGQAVKEARDSVERIVQKV